MEGAMYDEPYLETCCRSALHRVFLAGAAGRRAEAESKDARCLARLEGLGLVARDAAGVFRLTPVGRARHQSEVLGGKAMDGRAMGRAPA
jgi:hypothetical protein